jgi:hypothetical protein
MIERLIALGTDCVGTLGATPFAVVVAVTSALGVMAVGGPHVRRLLAVVALLRNLGGHRRQSAPGGARSRAA